MITKTFVVANPQGFHVRPTKTFVECAQLLPCEVYVIANGRRVNGKSSLGLLSLGLARNAEVSIEADGEQEERAIEELGRIMTDIFE
ncbi:HPr family phosphocarrier protein [Cohnella cellulosilytica]|uniref:HPr family phosphocarrier protein n=1 Tax=Cohnella cellulosilytica TaxID=986710 RepID=A0ABW2FJU3_9BACL